MADYGALSYDGKCDKTMGFRVQDELIGKGWEVISKHYVDPRGTSFSTDAQGFYKGLLDHLSDGVYFVDRDRRILYWNEGAIRLTGYTAEEDSGRCCQDNILCHVDQAGHELCQHDCPLTATIPDGECTRRCLLASQAGPARPGLGARTADP